MNFTDEEASPSSCNLLQQTRFTQLYNQHYERVYNYAFLLTQSQWHTEEIVQEVFIKVWSYRHKWDEVECFDAWLYTLMRNRTLDYLKKLSNERNLVKQSAALWSPVSNYTEENIQANECKQHIATAVEQLSPQRRLVYDLTRVHGCKREQVAKMLGISPNTVRVQMSEALKTIKRHLVKKGFRG